MLYSFLEKGATNLKKEAFFFKKESKGSDLLKFIRRGGQKFNKGTGVSKRGLCPLSGHYNISIIGLYPP
jgi:hypothetical protein